MSFGILASALLASASAPATAMGGEWTLWGTEAGRDYFIDAGSAPDAAGIVRFRIRQTFRPAAGEALPYHLAIADFDIDCRGQTVTFAGVTTYDAAGAANRSERVPDDRRDRDPIYAGSENEKFYLRYCPASLRKPLRAEPPPPILIRTTPPLPVPPPAPRPMAPPPAPPPPPPPSPNAILERARPVVPLASLFTADDYPKAASRAWEEGVVTYRLAIDRNGRVTRCTVTGSSGSSSLDTATCRLVTERARFKPARNGKGRRVADAYLGRILWRLPEEEPVPPDVPQ